MTELVVVKVQTTATNKVFESRQRQFFEKQAPLSFDSYSGN